MIDVRERPSIEEAPRATVDINTAIRDTLAVLGRNELPVFQRKDEISEMIRSNDLVIIEAETGSGKSTVTPILALLELQKRKPGGRVIVTQPRRVAAESLDNYLMQTMGERIGFRHGGRRVITDNTQLEFAIERSLLNDMVRNNDFLLLKYDTVILDEVHERKVDLDILMPLLKKAQAKRKEMGKPLKIILTSATMDRERMLEYFIGAAHVEIPGKMFEVTEHFESESIDIRDVMARAAKKASDIHARGNEEPGDMLIFMPGQAEIEKTIAELEKQKNLTDDGVEFVTLIGGAESAESTKRILEKSEKRRIFVATNVAETSITIPSVRIVIDSGLMRMNVFNPETGINGLQTLEHTKSNAKQRKGRGGRTAAGNVHYLYTKEDLEKRLPYLPAEILRTDLVAQVLLMKQIGIEDIPNFDFLDHPGMGKINQAIDTLNKLGALNPDGTLSEIGIQMTEYNAEPRFARMLVEAKKLGCLDAVSILVGMLQNTKYDVFSINRKIEPNMTIPQKYAKFIVPGSDILTRLNVWNQYLQHNYSKTERKKWEEENGLRTYAFYVAGNARKDIFRKNEDKRKIKDEPIDIGPENSVKISQCLAVGLLDNITLRKNGEYQTISGTRGVQIDKWTSVLSGTSWEAFIAGSLRRTERGGIFAGFNFEITLDTIKKLMPNFGEDQKTEAKPEVKKATAQTETEKPDQTPKSNETPIVSRTPFVTQPEQKPIKPPEEHKKETQLQKIRKKVSYWIENLLKFLKLDKFLKKKDKPNSG